MKIEIEGPRYLSDIYGGWLDVVWWLAMILAPVAVVALVVGVFVLVMIALGILQ